jgi:hypothetical protein
MKTMILAAVAALSLGVGSAYAAGGPVGYQAPVYGSQAFTDHSNEVATQFLGPNTVLGKAFHHSNSNQVAATASPKG